MKKIISISVLILAILTMFGTFSNDPTVQAQTAPLLISETTGDVSGYVYLGSSNNNPLDDGYLTIGHYEAVTYTDGSYIFSDVPPGRYKITAYAPYGYCDESDLVTVVANQVTNKDFHLDVQE